MTNKENKYYAEKGKFIIRKSDGLIMGEHIDLGSEDTIDNYEERAYTEEEYNSFYETYGENNHRIKTKFKIKSNRHIRK